MEQVFSYVIDGKTYLQRKMKLGQYQQLLDVLKTISLPDSLDTASLIYAIGDKITRVLAIILCPEGVSPKDKNIDEVEKEMFSIDVEETVFKVIEDFFGCNDIQLLLKKFSQVITTVSQKLNPTENPTI